MTEKQVYLELILNSNRQDERELAMTRLIDAGFEGFVEEGDELKAFIPAEAFDTGTLQTLLSGLELTWTTNLVENENWNAAWEASFEPVRVGNFCLIRADFHEGDRTILHELVITPKMSFGTGHHATTYSMIEAMRDLNFEGRSVLDFGTGTGVLAILAEKLGAAEVTAIDNDQWSITNSLENIARNSSSRVKVKLAESVGRAGKYDVILANINRNVILDNMEDLALSLASGGKVLFSGFLEADLPAIRDSMLQHRLVFTGYTEKNGWLCVKGSSEMN